MDKIVLVILLGLCLASLQEDLDHDEEEKDAKFVSTARLKTGLRLVTDYSMLVAFNHSRKALVDFLLDAVTFTNIVFNNFEVEHVPLDIRVHVLPNTTSYNQEVGHWNSTLLMNELDLFMYTLSQENIALNIFFTAQTLLDKGEIVPDEEIGGMTRMNSAFAYFRGWQILIHYGPGAYIKHTMLHEMMHAYGLEHSSIGSEFLLMHPSSVGFYMTHMERIELAKRIIRLIPLYELKLHTCGNGVVEPTTETCERNLPFLKVDLAAAKRRGLTLHSDDQFNDSNCDLSTCQLKSPTHNDSSQYAATFFAVIVMVLSIGAAGFIFYRCTHRPAKVVGNPKEIVPLNVITN